MEKGGDNRAERSSEDAYAGSKWSELSEIGANRYGGYRQSKWSELKEAKNGFLDKISGREAERRQVEDEAFNANERCRELREIGTDFGEKMQEMQLYGVGERGGVEVYLMSDLLQRAVEQNGIKKNDRLITRFAFWNDLEMLDEVNAGIITEKDLMLLTGGSVNAREMKLAFRDVRKFADEARREAGLGKPMRPSMSRQEAKRLMKRMARENDEFVDTDDWGNAGLLLGDNLVARENNLAILNLEKLCHVSGGFTDDYEKMADESREKEGGTDPKREMVKEIRSQLRSLKGKEYTDLVFSFEALADDHPSPFIDDMLSVEAFGSKKKCYLGLNALTERKPNGQPLLSDDQVINVVQWYNHAAAAERRELQAECTELEDSYVEGIDVAVSRGLLPRKFRHAADVFRKGARRRSPSSYHLADLSSPEREQSWMGWTLLGPERDKVDIFLDMRLMANGKTDRRNGGFSRYGIKNEFKKEVLMHEMTHNIAGQTIFPSRSAETIINEAMTEHIATIVLEAGEEHRSGGNDIWMGRDLWEGATGRRWAADNLGYTRGDGNMQRKRKMDVHREPSPYRFGSGTTYPSERETLRFLQSQGRHEIPIETFYDAYVGEKGDGSRERLLHAIQRSFPQLRSVEEIEDFIINKNDEIRKQNTPSIGKLIEKGLRAIRR